MQRSLITVVVLLASLWALAQKGGVDLSTVFGKSISSVHLDGLKHEGNIHVWAKGGVYLQFNTKSDKVAYIYLRDSRYDVDTKVGILGALKAYGLWTTKVTIDMKGQPCIAIKGLKGIPKGQPVIIDGHGLMIGTPPRPSS